MLSKISEGPEKCQEIAIRQKVPWGDISFEREDVNNCCIVQLSQIVPANWHFVCNNITVCLSTVSRNDCFKDKMPFVWLITLRNNKLKLTDYTGILWRYYVVCQPKNSSECKEPASTKPQVTCPYDELYLSVRDRPFDVFNVRLRHASCALPPGRPITTACIFISSHTPRTPRTSHPPWLHQPIKISWTAQLRDLQNTAQQLWASWKSEQWETYCT